METGILRETITGLDIGRGVSRFDDEAIYLDVLRSFTRNTKPLLAAISQVDSGQLGEYAVAVHGIKGSARGIFADCAADEAEALEMAAKSGDFAFVEKSNPHFIQTVSKLVADIDNTLAKCGVSVRACKAAPDEALLKKLYDACLSMDIDKMDSAMSKIEGFEYTADDGLVAWLRGKLDQGKYKDIADMLSGQI